MGGPWFCGTFAGIQHEGPLNAQILLNPPEKRRQMEEALFLGPGSLTRAGLWLADGPAACSPSKLSVLLGDTFLTIPTSPPSPHSLWTVWPSHGPVRRPDLGPRIRLPMAFRPLGLQKASWGSWRGPSSPMIQTSGKMRWSIYTKPHSLTHGPLTL